MLQAAIYLSHLRYWHTSVKHAWNGGSSSTGQESIVTHPKSARPLSSKETCYRCGAPAAATLMPTGRTKRQWGNLSRNSLPWCDCSAYSRTDFPNAGENVTLKQLLGESVIWEEVEKKSHSPAHPSRFWVVSSFRLSQTRQVSNWIWKGMLSQHWHVKNVKVVFEWKKNKSLKDSNQSTQWNLTLHPNEN